MTDRGRAHHGDICFWHETEVPISLRDVRVRGQSGRYLLGVSISHFDPERTN
jgi:hypothetical protein